MLVNATEMLQKARDGHYAVGQFNINNLEWTKAALQAAQEMNSPIILGVSEGAGKYMTGFKTVAAMVKAMIDTLGITVPVALHLDHGSYEGAKACVEAGFSSIMFDGSHYAIDENVAKTTELVALAHENGLSIEAEVGSIGGEEDGVVGMGEIADAAECARIASLGIDFLAAGIGNIHGVYPSNWKGLDFDALEKIHNATRLSGRRHRCVSDRRAGASGRADQARMGAQRAGDGRRPRPCAPESGGCQHGGAEEHLHGRTLLCAGTPRHRHCPRL